MRLAIPAVIPIGCAIGCLIGCGSRETHSAAPPAPAAVASFPAARWVPAKPSYVFASQTVDGAQQSLSAVIDLLGVVTGADLGDMTAALQGLLGVDPLHPDAVAAIGIDPHGSWAMFSEQLSPTIVVHLSAPDRMAAFLDRQRRRGVIAQPVTVDNTQVFSATLGPVTISWAIDADWMWVHFARESAPDDGARWFTASHGAHASDWTGTWSWAQRAAGAAAGLVGFFDLHGAIASALAKAPEAVACIKLVEPVGRVAVAVEGDEHHVAARLAIDVGSTTGIRPLILPAPAGWDATAARAAIAAQWNLDLTAVRSYIAPCLAVTGGQLAMVDAAAMRTARGMLLGFDPDAMSGSGAVALDITRPTFFEHQLDRIPLRGALESARTFGPYKGFSIAIPFSVTVEYVLDQKLAIAALGEGVLARLVMPGGQAAQRGQGGTGGPGASRLAPIAALDLAPPVLSARAWEAVVHAVAEQSLSGSPGPATRRFVEHLMRWRDLHLVVTAEPTELVLTASGNRR